jgi:lactate dehydrogenase-like 2-hydroxyacid dehydrogenase
VSEPLPHDPSHPTHLRTTGAFVDVYAAELERVAVAAGRRVVAVTVGASGPRIDAEILERVEIAFLPSDPGGPRDVGRHFFGAALRAPKLRWMQLPFSGLDAPVFGRLARRGVKLTNAPEANAEPVAHTAIAGLLALARGFPRWWEAQRRRAPRDAEHTPRELRGQTLVLLGVGAIGGEIARLARVLGLRVVGVVERAAATFLDNLGNWLRGEALRNEVLLGGDEERGTAR